MRIIFDYQIFLAQNHGGISRYFHNLISEINQDKLFEASIPIHNHNNEYLKSHLTPAKVGFFDSLFKRQDLNKEITLDQISSKNFDVFHPTYYDDYFLDKIDGKPFVITIHDMIYELFPEMFPLKDNLKQLKKKLSLKADKIVVVSEKTKEDLLKFIDVKEDKIAVVYQACSLQQEAIEKVKINKNLPKKYLLFVGNRGAYKNFYFMLSSISELLKGDPDLHLICFGSPFNKKENEFIKNTETQNKIINIQGDDNVLIGLYKGALAFISPSYYEGFGVTILESFACGCPVIAANTSATPEAAGKAAIYFDPKDPKSISNSVEKVMNDQNLRSEMISEGYKQNEKFSWDKAASEMKKIYQKLV